MNNSSPIVERLQTHCCVVGGGPAGIMLAFLLARAGVDVIVLEKHADFFRDFRGDTIHPSIFEIMYELGILDEFRKQPHQEVEQLRAQIGDSMITAVDFTHVPSRCKFLGFMPQWDFLKFLVDNAKQCRGFDLRMESEVTELIWEDGRVSGVRATTPRGVLEVSAGLIIGADGRHSTVRDQAGLEVIDVGAPIDVLWMRLSRHDGDPGQVLFRLDYGRFFLMIDRGDYYQCGLVIRKDALAGIEQKGLDAFRDSLGLLVPFIRDRLGEIRNWDDIHLLTVKIDRLRQWFRPGLLCIGDAAHAMSPVGGVGINLAIQDAVAAANILTAPLRQGAVSTDRLHSVQKRRELPTRMTQGLQRFVQKHVIEQVLESSKRMSPPLPIKLLERWPFLRRIPARVIGIGFRPEHVETPDLCNVRGARYRNGSEQD
jgi:2-polyprenyl-6-methoxyphenol hydroxylase-like FAD-dependent oxidoreductase